MCCRDESQKILSDEIDEHRGDYERYAEFQMRRFKPFPEDPCDMVQDSHLYLHTHIAPPHNYFSENGQLRLHHFEHQYKGKTQLRAQTSIRSTICYKVRDANKKYNIRRVPQIQLEEIYERANEKPTNPLLDALEHCFELMSQEDREIHYTSFKMTSKEAAEELGISHSGFLSRLARIRENLRRCIESYVNNE